MLCSTMIGNQDGLTVGGADPPRDEAADPAVGSWSWRQRPSVAWWHHVTHHVTHCAGFHPATFCPGFPPSNNNNFNRFISLTTPLLFPRHLPVGELVSHRSANPQAPTAHHAVALPPISRRALLGAPTHMCMGGSGQFNR
jgi:hypothetical protein